MPRKRNVEAQRHLAFDLEMNSGYAWSIVAGGLDVAEFIRRGDATFIAYNGGDLKTGHMDGVPLALTKTPVRPDEGWEPWKVLKNFYEEVSAIRHTKLLAHMIRDGKPYCTFLTYSTG
jgi:hypothetical protein